MWKEIINNMYIELPALCQIFIQGGKLSYTMQENKAGVFLNAVYIQMIVHACCNKTGT